MYKELSWEDYYHLRKSFDFDAFVFLAEDFRWLPGDQVIVSQESIYDDDEVSDCDTPMKLFNRGFRFRFLGSEATAYDDTWIYHGGVDNLENFNKCLRNYLENDSYLFPEN